MDGAASNRMFTAEDEQSRLPNQMSQASVSPSEARRVGKVHSKEARIEEVVAKEMDRIRQAFDRRVVDHTEELVTKVQSGQPLVQKSTDSAGPP